MLLVAGWLLVAWLPGEENPAADPLLDKPRAAFTQAVEKARRELLEQISRRLDMARSKGDRNQVKRLKDDQEALKLHLAPHLSFPTPAHEAALDRAGKGVQSEYSRIIRKNTMEKRDDRAEFAEKELKKLLASIQPQPKDEKAPADPPLAEANRPWSSLLHASSMRYLLREGGTSAAPGITLAANLDTDGHWQVQTLSPGLVRLLHRKTGKFLTPAVVSAQPGTAVVLKAPMKTEGHQAWQMVQADRGQVRLIHQRTGRPLTAAENGVVLGDLAKPGAEIVWKITPLK